MALILLACDKGSPGATTTALALAAAWPRPVLLAETDPSGGDLIYRLHTAGRLLDPRTGLASLATAPDPVLTPTLLHAHTQIADDALPVLLGPASQDQAAILAGLWPRLGPALARHRDPRGAPADVIADCGRLTHDSPALTLLPYATHTILLARAALENLAHLRDRALYLAAWRAAHGAAPAPTALLTIASRKDADRAGAVLHRLFAHAGLPAHLVGTLPLDPAGAASLTGSSGRSDLERAARALAARLAQPSPPAANRPQPIGARP